MSAVRRPSYRRVWSLELHVTVRRNETCGQGEGRNSSGGRMSVVVLRNDAYG